MLPPYLAIAAERVRQDHQWGWPREELDHADWLAILVEEFGELGKAVVEIGFYNRRDDPISPEQAGLVKELVHTAAVCVAWLQSIELAGEGA